MFKLYPSITRKSPFRLFQSLLTTNLHLLRTLKSSKSPKIPQDIDLSLPEWDRGGKTKLNSLTPLYSMSKKLIDANPGAVCLIQVGSFYELYFEQAEIYGTKLGLKVATRKTSNYNIPMAGFPLIQLEKYVKMLVSDLQVNVAIIDQFSNQLNLSDKMIHRKISRIISPGTLVDETFINYNTNNYLLAISLPANVTNQPHDLDTPVGLSWIDLSVGDFYVQQTTLAEMISDIARINPSEIILSKELMKVELDTWYPGLQDLKKYFIRYHKTVYNDLKLLFKCNLNRIRTVMETFSTREEAAMNMVLSYINVNLPERNPSLDLPVKYWSDKYLQMDSRTRDALELVERNSVSGKNLVVGSLLNTIRRTVTSSGTRLLTEWIKSPILDMTELNRRQKFVKFFIGSPNEAIVIEEFLGKTGDFVRGAQRLTLNTGDVISNLKLISQGLSVASELKRFLSNSGDHEIINDFLQEFEVPETICEEINDTFEETRSFKEYEGTEEDEEALAQGIFAIRKDYNKDLLTLHEQLQEFRLTESNLFNKIGDKVKEIDPKLTLQAKKVHGKFFDVIYVNGRAKLIDEVNAQFVENVRERRKNMILIKTPDWKYLQNEITVQMDRIREMENIIIENLKAKTIDHIVGIRKLSKQIDFLDVTLSFSKLAQEYNLCCPQFTKGNQLVIEEGRHIVVESSLKKTGSNFTENDIKLNQKQNIWVISGPNMGGKSTFLRQNALIVILAQIGSFVPAKSCKLGTVDKLFTRIGASDDLFNDLSTFMVEMVEVSNILKNATRNSFAIVDEVGRGTCGKEGLAIAYSTLISLLNKNKCKTLFATHFGSEIAQLLKENESTNRISFHKTGVIEELKDGKLSMVITHKLKPGISEKSYAIEVAQLAGFPKYSLDIAKEALKNL